MPDQSSDSERPFRLGGLPAQKTPDGLSLIAKERHRQLAHHQFGAERDDQYLDNELVSAAIHYAHPADWPMSGFWPNTWDRRYDQKITDPRIEQLAKAGALIAAEIDRLLRLQG